MNRLDHKNSLLATSYDEIPYPRLAFSYTHPSHLATVGRLLGLRPAAVDRCRVLELGCASGANLAPMAYAIPGSRFVGIDLSERQIADGHALVSALGLTNLTLEPMDIRVAADSLAERFEPFDYIIAHGIYSWVPDAVKESLLAVCRRLLAPHGIAYVSYRCDPGGQIREVLRRMCHYHGRREPDSPAFATRSRAFLEFLLSALPPNDDAYRAAVVEQAANLLVYPDSILLHDALERDNDPLLFHQFIAAAARHGLQYAGDAHFSHMLGIGIDAAALYQIRQSGGALDFQQRLDFLYGRALRSTLLCHQEIDVRHELVPAAVHQLWIASAAAVVLLDGTTSQVGELERFDIDDRAPLNFRTEESTTSIANRIGKAAMLELCVAYPQALPFDALVERVGKRLASAGPARRDASAAVDPLSLAEQLAHMAIRWFATRLVDLSAFAPPMASGLERSPVASAVARYQVAHGWAGDSAATVGFAEGQGGAAAGIHVTNLWHRRILLGGELVGRVVLQLDGNHDRPAIVESLAAPVLRGKATMHFDGKRLADPLAVRNVLAERVDSCIADLARSALLVKTS